MAPHSAAIASVAALSLSVLQACSDPDPATTAATDGGTVSDVDPPTSLPLTVDFSSAGVAAARASACAQTFDNPTRVGAAAEVGNAPNLWSVSPYLILIPAGGEGFVSLNIDAVHFDWLVYTTSDVTIEGLGGPPLELGGAVAECPAQDLVEYGGHHHEIIGWPLKLNGQAGSRAQVFAALSGTEHSDPDAAGHAGHNLSGDVDAGTIDNH